MAVVSSARNKSPADRVLVLPENLGHLRYILRSEEQEKGTAIIKKLPATVHLSVIAGIEKHETLWPFVKKHSLF